MNLNPDFILLIQQQTGADAEKFFEALQEPQSTSVRINNKIEAADLEILSSSRPIPYCATGYSLPSRPDFTLDPMLHGGAYYVQEASSMYLESIISKYITGSVRCLDLCAAPGGKSTHLASLLSFDSLIISNEIMPQRANILAENMIKWGNGNTLVTNNKPSDFKKLGAIFDIIVADVPCSGEGMFRKEPQAVEQWSLDNVMMCAERQKDITSDIWSTLKEGGLLVYSTCTFNHFEDEDNVEWIASELGAEILEQRHFYFHETIGEGFYIAVLRKTSAAVGAAKIKPSKQKKSPATATVKLLKEPSGYAVIETSECLCAVPQADKELYTYVAENFRTLKCGVPLCSFKGKDEIPAHALAVSKALDVSKTAVCNVDKPTALSYLRREAINIDSTERGYVLITYNNLPLGWVKNLGNRCNNLYPDYWRIRKQ
ncbi:MAG: rRNA cytosine-C5-methyltransferase [Paludibacteraceae bacterium]|nr:rRNA cytosine-C5-methyltransferase [Paludibacteraceae bacterium]